MTAAHFKRILIPTDLSDFSALALKYGALFHQRLGSELTLLHVNEARTAAIERLQMHARLYAPGIETRNVIRTGSPSRRIVEAADEFDTDLIIMSTHGRNGVDRALLGSVTERVLRISETPVLTVCPFHFALEGQISISRIVCPVSSTTVAQSALSYAMSLARAFDADLDTRDMSGKSEGAPLPDIGSHFEADLLVIGARHRFFSDATVLGTTSGRIARSARVPVITVPLSQARSTTTAHRGTAMIGGRP